MNGSLPRKTTPSPAALVEHVEHFQRRVLQDALADATAAHWHHRADDFLAARPRLGDFHGQATTDDLRRRWHELTEVANACRARANVSPIDEIAPEVEQVWGEAS